MLHDLVEMRNQVLGKIFGFMHLPTMLNLFKDGKRSCAHAQVPWTRTMVDRRALSDLSNLEQAIEYFPRRTDVHCETLFLLSSKTAPGRCCARACAHMDGHLATQHAAWRCMILQQSVESSSSKNATIFGRICP